jgi:hypothetical protein
VKSQRAPANADTSDKRRKMLVTAGNSVEVSGFRRGVNWATGYTKVWLEDEEEKAGLLSDAWMRGLSTFEAYATKSWGSSNGDGAPLEVGQSKRYPE